MWLQVYIGEEGDTTIHGGSIMAFAKSWKSGPIHSWSGGKKLADMPGGWGRRFVYEASGEEVETKEQGEAGKGSVCMYVLRPSLSFYKFSKLKLQRSNPEP